MDVLRKLTQVSPESAKLFACAGEAIFAVPPYSLGYPGSQVQSAYYPGDIIIVKNEIVEVTLEMEKRGLHPENTRLLKTRVGGSESFKILQASVQVEQEEQFLCQLSGGAKLSLVKGDHSHELKSIVAALHEARKHASNNIQQTLLSQYIESFQTGNLDVYRESLKTWLQDKLPHIENIFGFVEPYRDPHGVRAEFEGLVAIKDPEETKLLQKLVDNSEMFIATLPWVVQSEDKFAFENKQFDPPDLTSIHTVAYCSSILFPGINLPNYNDIRQDCGFKNMIIANRMAAESSQMEALAFLDSNDVEAFQKHKSTAYYIWVVLHELLGHGTGKMLRQINENSYNFNMANRPVNPLTNDKVDRWYTLGQTWTGQFGDLATTVDECRAELVGAFLFNNAELLKLFGHDENSSITADDLVYNLYLQLATDGLRGLANYNIADNKWGQAHSRAHFATLMCLLRDGHDVVSISMDEPGNKLTVRVDRQKIASGHAALGNMLLRLHMYRITADVEACRTYYEDLSTVDDDCLKWREIVPSIKSPKLIFCQPNTVLIEGKVKLKEYGATREGIIQSWAERQL